MDTGTQPIRPERITTPIQLLGAWLAGLLAVDSCFLFAATNMEPSSWQSIALTIAAIINVPLFISAVFLLQTKFRPELQEDLYYSSYLNQKTNEVVRLSQQEVLEIIERKVASLEREHYEAKEPANTNEKGPLARLSVGINHHLANIDNIERRIVELGVTSSSYFGGEDAPPHLKVAIAGNIPIQIRRQIIEIAHEFGFQYFGVFDPSHIEFNEDVLFGAYGSDESLIEIAA